MQKKYILWGLTMPLVLLGDTIIGITKTTTGTIDEKSIFISPTGKGTKCTLLEPCNIMLLDTSNGKIKIKAGDKIFFRGGVYAYSMNRFRRIYLKGGKKGKPVTYESYPGELAIFDGSELDIQHKEKEEWREGRLELRENYTILRNIEVRNMPEYGIRIFGNHNIVEGCIVHNNHLSGIEILNNKDGYSPKSTGGSFNIVRNNTIYNNSDVGLQYGNYNLGGNADGITIHSGVKNLITHNIVYGNSDDGIDTYKSMYSTVSYNLVYGNGKGKNGNANGIKLGGSDNKLGLHAIAKHNISYANNGFGFTVHGKENNTTIEFNTAYDNKKAGYAILNDTTIKNNISYLNKKGDLVWSKGQIQENNSWQRDMKTFKFINYNLNSKNFLKPSSDSKLEDIGAYGH